VQSSRANVPVSSAKVPTRLVLLIPLDSNSIVSMVGLQSIGFSHQATFVYRDLDLPLEDRLH
jgi:hypothetical protein